MKKLLLSCLLFLGMVLNAQITLGSGTTKGPAPISTYYGYSYVQQIFPKSEINANAAGNITGLKFYLSSSATLTNSDDWIVYLGHTTNSTFSSSTAWIPLANLTQKYAGTVTNNAGVVDITFATPFAYNNIDNLVVAVKESKPDYDSNGSGEAMYVYPSAPNSCLYYRDDTTNPDPASPPTGVLYGNKSIVTFLGLTPSTLPGCPTVTAPAANATGVSELPTINWGAISNATGYKLSVGTTAGGTDIMNANDLGNVTTYTFTAASQLQYSKQYFYKVNSYNGATPSAGCTENNFTVKNIPCPVVSAPTANATAVSLTTTITWAAVTGATGYKLRVGTTAGGADIANNIDLGNVTSYTFAPSTLVGSTKYFYSVNSYNTTSNSASCSERNFTTVCSAFSAPFTENFNTGVLPNCWTTSSTDNTGYALWQFTGPQDYGTTGNGASGTVAFVDASSPYTGVHDVTLVSPQINLAGLTAPYLQFKWFKNHGTAANPTTQPAYDNNKLTVQIKTVAGVTWETLFTSSTNNSAWRTEGMALPVAYNGQTVQVRFVVDKDVAGNGYFYDNLLLDDVELKQAPTCIMPNTLANNPPTPTGATVTWVAPTSAPALGYDVYYSATNTAPTSTSTPQYVGVTATTQNIPGTAGTVFYVWVRSRCSATNQSSWVGPISYTIPLPPPANDNCASPLVLTPGNNFASNAITATNVGSTTDGTPQSCQTSANNNVWFSVVVPSSGNITIETQAAAGSSYTDSIINVFSGSCGSLVAVTGGCNDDFGSAAFSLVSLTGQTPGAVLLVSVWRWSNSSVVDGQFKISAYDASLSTSEASQVKNNIKVYPNPFADVLNISDVKNVKSVSVMDIAGRLVKTIEKPSSDLHLGELKSGMYLVVLNMNDGSKQTIKAIKK